jgi:hypothetical protein
MAGQVSEKLAVADVREVGTLRNTARMDLRERADGLLLKTNMKTL